jgi:hypothetical protein
VNLILSNPNGAYDRAQIARNNDAITRAVNTALRSSSDASITGLWSFDADLHVTGLLTISGDTTVTGSMSLEGDTAISGDLTITGDTTVAGLTLTANVLPDVTNTHDVGSSSLKLANVWATIFHGTATSALYADLAERYHADADYPVGTVLVLGGANEVTISQYDADHRVVGIVSKKPAYRMNSGAGNDATHPYLALTGRVPCRVWGRVQRGDLLVTSSAMPGCAMRCEPYALRPGTLVGRAMEAHRGDDEEGVIEVAVSRG